MGLKRAENLAETARWKLSLQALFLMNFCVLFIFIVPSEQGLGGFGGKLGLIPVDL